MPKKIENGRSVHIRTRRQMNYRTSPATYQRRDKRASRQGLIAETNRQKFPIINFSMGGLLLSEANVGFSLKHKLFLTLYHVSNPADKAFVYGYVVWKDSFNKLVGIDLAKNSEAAYQYLESMMNVAPRARSIREKKKVGGWLSRVLSSR